MLATLPLPMQAQIKRLLAQGNFRAAKTIYDRCHAHPCDGVKKSR